MHAQGCLVALTITNGTSSVVIGYIRSEDPNDESQEYPEYLVRMANETLFPVYDPVSLFDRTTSQSVESMNGSSYLAETTESAPELSSSC